MDFGFELKISLVNFHETRKILVIMKYETLLASLENQHSDHRNFGCATFDQFDCAHFDCAQCPQCPCAQAPQAPQWSWLNCR
jgi:hypothetical protein